MNGFEYTINNLNKRQICDEVSEKIFEFVSSHIAERKEALRYRITIEECLLNWVMGDSDGKVLTLILKKSLLNFPIIEIQLSGERCDPCLIDDSVLEFEYSNKLILGLAPVYNYRNGRNILRFDIKSKVGYSSVKILAAVLILSVIFGFAGLMILSTDTLTDIKSIVIDSVSKIYLNALSCVAGPMIFFSVAWGVYGIGDTSTFSKIGKKMIFDFLRTDVLAALFCLIFIPFVGLKIGFSDTSLSQASGLIDMILDIVPSNIIDPFLNGNTLQIIFMAFMLGLSLLFLGKKSQEFARIIGQINYVFIHFMEHLGKLVPIFVFFVIVALFWSGDVETLSSGWKILIFIVLAMIIFSLIFVAITAKYNKVKFTLLLKKCLPSFVLGVTTASSAATFSTNIDICQNRLGVNESVVGFCTPLGMIMQSPGAVINNILVAFIFASKSNIDCNLIWILTAIVVCTIIATSVPPIPGGGVVIYTIIFNQLGISAEYLPIVFAIDMLSDFFITAVKMFLLDCSVLNIAKKSELVDQTVLISTKYN